MPYDLKFTVGAADVAAYATYSGKWFYRRVGLFAYIYPWCLVVFLGYALVYWTAVNFEPEDFTSNAGPDKLGWHLLAIIAFSQVREGTSWFARRRMIKRYARENGMFLGDFELSVGEGGIEVASTGARSWYAWPTLQHVENARGHLFLMLDNAYGLIVPKRAFARPEDVEGFVAALARRGGETGD